MAYATSAVPIGATTTLDRKDTDNELSGTLCTLLHHPDFDYELRLNAKIAILNHVSRLGRQDRLQDAAIFMQEEEQALRVELASARRKKSGTVLFSSGLAVVPTFLAAALKWWFGL